MASAAQERVPVCIPDLLFRFCPAAVLSQESADEAQSQLKLPGPALQSAEEMVVWNIHSETSDNGRSGTWRYVNIYCFTNTNGLTAGSNGSSSSATFPSWFMRNCAIPRTSADVHSNVS